MNCGPFAVLRAAERLVAPRRDGTIMDKRSTAVVDQRSFENVGSDEGVLLDGSFLELCLEAQNGYLSEARP